MRPIERVLVGPVVILGGVAVWYIIGRFNDVVLSQENLHAARLWVDSWF